MNILKISTPRAGMMLLRTSRMKSHREKEFQTVNDFSGSTFYKVPNDGYITEYYSEWVFGKKKKS